MEPWTSTDEQLRDKARVIVLDDIADQMHDRMGLGEQLEDEAQGLNAADVHAILGEGDRG
jgi:hypothetical protein